MPSIMLKNVAAGTANALDGLQFQDLDGPALVSIYGSTPTAGGNIDYSVGTERYLVGAQVNIEVAADVVDNDRDQVLFREPVAAGRQYLGVNDQICNVLVVIEELS